MVPGRNWMIWAIYSIATNGLFDVCMTMSRTTIINSLLNYFRMDAGSLLKLLNLVITKLPQWKPVPGLYEVISHDIVLELKDAKGKRAIYQKRQKVRFLQDNIVAYLDKAWGDGDIFAEYRCSPGVAVDRFREGHRYNILISLRETKNRGEVEEFHIERQIEQGFTQPVEELQSEIDHRTSDMSMAVIFPKSRPVREAHLIQQNGGRSTALDAKHFTKLPDGRQQVRWHTRQIRLYEAYILRWRW